jgi:hypothetical protein
LDDVLAPQGVYGVTAVRDTDPDEVLRRFGVAESVITDGTWAALLAQANAEAARQAQATGQPLYTARYRLQAVAAFALGPHTLLVEDNDGAAVSRPDLSAGTFAVTAYQSINSDVAFVVSRDGVELAGLDENAPSSAFGAEPEVLREPLAAMGITDPEVFDADPENYHRLDVVQLFCRLGGIRPTVRDVSGSARIAVFPRID